jgi:hypothetical protein
MQARAPHPMWLNLNGFGYDIANDCNATERVYLQNFT